MAITKIQAGALPADVITTAAIDDASITHAKLHTTMDLSSKTVTLPMLNQSLTLDGPDAGVAKLRLQAEEVHGDIEGINIGNNYGGLAFKTNNNGTVAERVRIDNAGNVGIGETNPLGKLHVKTADSGATADASADELVIEGSGNTGISILSGASNAGSIYFGDSGTNWDGYIAYSQSSRSMTLGTAAGGGSVNIDSSGNVGIGTSNPSTMLHLSAGTTNGQGGSDAGITMTNKYDNPDNSWSIKPAIQGVSNTGLEIRDVTDSRSVMVFDGSGNVGIRTNSPDAPLDVTRVGDGTIAIFQNTGLHGFEFSAPSSTALQIASRQGSKNLDLWANTLSFSAGGSESMRIDSSGRLTVGSIGTDTTLSGGQPGLQVTGSGFNGYMAAVRRDSSVYSSGLLLAKSRNSTADNFTVLQDNDKIGSIIFIGDDGTDLDTYGAMIQAEVNGTPSNNNMPTDLIFSTNSGTSATTERMRIDRQGRVTTPNQPRVFAQGNISNWSNQSANQVYTAWQTTGANGSYAVGISYDAATGRFTVPVAGTYYIYSARYIRIGPGYNTNAARLNIRMNGGHWVNKHIHSNENIPDISICIEGLIPMAASDYFTIDDSYATEHYRGFAHTYLHAYLVG